MELVAFAVGHGGWTKIPEGGDGVGKYTLVKWTRARKERR